MKKSDYTILVADDDPDYLFQTVFSLGKAGYKTVTAESQAEAESIMQKFKPDLAIFDLMMESDDSGFILCYKIRSGVNRILGNYQVTYPFMDEDYTFEVITATSG